MKITKLLEFGAKVINSAEDKDPINELLFKSIVRVFDEKKEIIEANTKLAKKDFKETV